MPKFIKLALYDGGEDFLVRADAIQAVVPLRAHAVVIIGPDQHTEVMQTVAQVAALLDG